MKEGKRYGDILINCMPVPSVDLLLSTHKHTDTHTATNACTTVHNNNNTYMTKTFNKLIKWPFFSHLRRNNDTTCRHFHNAVWGIGRTNSELAVQHMDLF